MNTESQDVHCEVDFESFNQPELSENEGDFFADSECPSDRFDKESRQGRCKIWVNRVTRHNSSIISCSNSSSVSANEEYKSISDGYSSDSDKSTGRKRRKTVKTTDKQKLLCEWKNCTHETTDMDNFQLHVSNHIPQLELRTKDNGEEVYGCLWALCDFETENPQEVQRHVNHHAYHTRLKAVGSTISLHWNLPKCGYVPESRNLVPDLPNPFLCDWLKCGKLFNNMQAYKYHIALHLNSYSSTFDTQRCMWKGCKSMFQSKVRLKGHLRTHTKDKLVACPNCGIMLASNSKYYDHCKRQIPIETSAYQCSHCMKSFNTKRLLREHMRSHINHYKCCFCDMTCSNPSVLSAHIRYKHLDAKPFVCVVCGFACKTHQDLKTHGMTHNPEKQFSCDKDGCDFSCRSKRTLVKHMIDIHEISETPIYCCHMSGCTKTFKRGSYLTKHLMEKHYLSWPSGHSKFIYRREEDGFYRLQTLRYESLEVTKGAALPRKEIELSTEFKITRNTKCESEVADFVIEVNREKEVTSLYPEVILSPENEQEAVDDPNEVTEKEVVICIEDEQGTILKFSTVKIKNKSMPVLPVGAKLIAAAEQM